MTGAVKAAVQEPPKQESSGLLNTDTGFPEPLSPYRNTTLRHPSADTSPNACLESSDISTQRPRSGHSSIPLPRIGSSRHRPKGALASGSLGLMTLISPIDSTDGLYDDMQYTNGTKEPTSVEELTREQMDGTEGLDGVKEEEPAGGEHGYQQEGKKKGMFRKFHLHKVS